MTRSQLINALNGLLPAQFDTLIGKLGAPEHFLSGKQTPLATRALEILRWADQRDGGVAEVERVLAEVMKTDGARTSDNATVDTGPTRRSRATEPRSARSSPHQLIRSRRSSGLWAGGAGVVIAVAATSWLWFFRPSSERPANSGALSAVSSANENAFLLGEAAVTTDCRESPILSVGSWKPARRDMLDVAGQLHLGVRPALLQGAVARCMNSVGSSTITLRLLEDDKGREDQRVLWFASAEVNGRRWIRAEIGLADTDTFVFEFKGGSAVMVFHGTTYFNKMCDEAELPAYRPITDSILEQEWPQYPVAARAFFCRPQARNR